jgi:NDP-sugar pyrophosphorylase family protein|tara:strand:- start:3268 stop:3945 length:678 start_codon:yes stop_codon:yes gene_type:complete
MDLLIPAAGLATRMRGLPKFLLPVDNTYTTILENHIKSINKENIDIKNIWIATRPDLVSILNTISFELSNINIIPMETNTMNETILNLCKISKAQYYMLIMPDTYYHGEHPYSKFENTPEYCDLAIWKIKDEQRGKLGEVRFNDDGSLSEIIDKNPDANFEYSWGALTFSEKFIKYIDKNDSHVGYSVALALKDNKKITTKIINGEYFDCGTPEEFIELIKKVFI